ncbi:DUF4166 domain-containing protein [Bacillus velezensis]
MTDSMYEKAITHYQSLHPMLQKRYRFDGSRRFCGEGVMSEIKGGSFLVRMLLKSRCFFQMFFLREGKRYPFHYRKQKQAKWRGMESYLFL